MNTFSRPVSSGWMAALPYAGVGVRFAAQPRPPAVEVAGERPGANYAQVVAFCDMFDGNYSITHNL